MDAGFAPDLGARLDKAVADKRVWNQHGLVVLRGNRLVLERYFEGEDEARGVGAIGRVLIDGHIVPEAAIIVRRKAGEWHPLFQIIATVAFPLIYAVYLGVAERVRAISPLSSPGESIQVSRPARRPDGYRAVIRAFSTKASPSMYGRWGGSLGCVTYSRAVFAGPVIASASAPSLSTPLGQLG